MNLKYTMTKTARSKMYEKYDTLSPESQKRIRDSGVLRSGDQVFGGIERGNKAIIKKGFRYKPQGVKTKVKGIMPIELSPKTVGEGLNFKGGLDGAYVTIPHKTFWGAGDYAKSVVNLPDRSDPATAEALDAYLKKATNSKKVNAGNLNSIFKRHEIYEAQDPVNMARGLNQMKGVSRLGVKDAITGAHNSYGVLGKEKKLLHGFSYLPEYQQMNTLRRRSGENQILQQGFGQAYDDPKNYTKKQIKQLSKLEVSPSLTHKPNNLGFYPDGGGKAWDSGKAILNHIKKKPIQGLRHLFLGR